jgi:hydroxyethylthiazole kinase-like uncharacterized protein yjeF
MTRFIVTAAEMRAAEEAAIAAGTPVETLMERAGTAAAEAIRLYAGALPALVLCGPGNNGGDGYVIARRLTERGLRVRVAALGEPGSPAAAAARSAWPGEIESVEEAAPAPLLVDALFGTGLARPLEPWLTEKLGALADAARVRVAVDLPSGVAADDGALLSPAPAFDLTVTFAALKPSHLLQPAAAAMGRIVVADIGVEVDTRLVALGRPLLPGPGASDHKYSRGYMAVVGGEMAGAAALAAAAALRSGAGYVRLVAPQAVAGLPHAIVQGRDLAVLGDPRVSAILVGPGIGTSEEGAAILERARAAGAPLVLDADALTLLAGTGGEGLRSLAYVPILTPHAGEFERLFPGLSGSKVERARAAAERSNAVVIFKGADTVVAAPDGRAAISAASAHWLATAGTGDVLAAIVAAQRARGLDAFEAACAGVWLHARAGERAGAGLIADDLLGHLPGALEECA